MAQQNNSGGVLNAEALHGRVVQLERERDFYRDLNNDRGDLIDQCLEMIGSHREAVPEQFRPAGRPVEDCIRAMADELARLKAVAVRAEDDRNAATKSFNEVYVYLIGVDEKLRGGWPANVTPIGLCRWWIDHLADLSAEAYSDDGDVFHKFETPLDRWQIVDHQTGDVSQFVTGDDGKTFLEVVGSVIGVEDVPDDAGGSVTYGTNGSEGIPGAGGGGSAEPDHPPGHYVNPEPRAREAPAGDPRFHALLRKIGELHDRKQKDYGVAGDPFANIRASVAFGVPAWVGAVLRGNDKMKRIQAFIQNGKLANESVEDSLLDLAVYAMIALILFQEGQEQQRAA